MAKARWLQAIFLQALALAPLDATAAAPECDAYASYDRPELAAPGGLAVGRRLLPLDGPAPLPGDSSNAPKRRLDLLVWYPATLHGCASARPYSESLVNHPWRRLPADKVAFEVASAATPDAPPARDMRYPLVLVSHGLLGWASGLSYLGEHLASRGYVVASIDHRDEQAVDPLNSAIALRQGDDDAAIEAMRIWSRESEHFLHGLVDMDRVAIVGYSMGGYGALQSASQVRGAKGLRSVVAIAPWGGQSSVGVVDRARLRKVALPLLFIVGDHDDVSGFEDGVHSLFQAARSSERWMLKYENARHNVGGYPMPDFARQVPARQTFFLDPVWRTERIQAVNRHFVTAFLDLTLKGDAGRRAYLEPATPKSNDGEWPLAPGIDPGNQPADASAAPRFWRGFQRRSALGLELLKLEPGQPGATN